MARTRIALVTRLLVASTFAIVALAPAAAHAKRVSLALAFGDDVLLAGDETLSLRAQCLANDAGSDRVRIYAVTASNAVLRGVDGYGGNGSYLLPGTPVVDSELARSSVTPGTEQAGFQIDAGAFVFNLEARIGYGLAQETTVLTLNVGAADCLLSADIETIKKFKEAK